MNALVIDFFMLYSRIEYALVFSPGFLNKGRGGEAKPDWVKFAEVLGVEFFEKHKSAKETRVLWDDPPWQLIASKDEKDVLVPKFEDMSKKHRKDQDFWPICLLRNRIFHGQSHDYLPRHKILLEGAIIVLNDALTQSRDKKELAHFIHNFDKSALRT